MNRMEFIEKLQRALAGGLNSNQVTDHVRYYQEYIDMEIRKGKTEAEVLDGLGDPRLLAKSIIEANKRAGASEGTNRTYDEEMAGAGKTYRGGAYSGGAYSDQYSSGQTYRADENNGSGGRVFRIPGWLILLIVTVVVILIIGVAFSLISVLAPIIIPVLIVILLVRVFQSDR
ncbi:MAG: DUF1700 domain-containing protein [Lachnospiraceae bacterium]|nr:DUF1700 domain-containing protein [Lachnospiraceae bacterium]